MKKSFFLILVFCSSILTKTFAQDDQVQGTWNGNASLVEKFSGPIGNSERYIDVTIKNNQVTGTHKYKGTTNVPGDIPDECFGTGPGELTSVTIRTWDGTYDINILSPECKLISDGGNSGTGGTNIGISNQRLQVINGQLNTTVLSGTETTTRTIEGFGTYTVTTTWFLAGSIDAQLIVIPKDYNNWMPEATDNELRKGDTMHIDLKVQGRNGGAASLKVARFELKLSNTSREKGTTLNMPLSPSPRQLPDLRFIPHPIAESKDEDQYIEITSADGKTGSAIIASYDGGGWTTLTAVAVLQGGIRIEGTLLTPTGVKEIPIPKRNGTSKIAAAWLAQYGNPADTADHELPAGHAHKGDGLSAYEEYRGVITKGAYKKLNPLVQELGIKGKKEDLDLFDYGITMFKNATMVEPIKFDELEIDADRRLNKNASYANVCKQFALLIHPGHIRRLNTKGQPVKVAGKAVNGPNIPEKISEVIIDTGVINSGYRDYSSRYQSVGVPVLYSYEDALGIVVAHEISHGISVPHHGTENQNMPEKDSVTTDGIPPVNAWDEHGVFLNPVNYIFGSIGNPQGTQSGDLGCYMAYSPFYDWALHDNIMIRKYYRVPDLGVGTKMCRSPRGTGINANGKYFGDAMTGRGNCLGQIQFK